MEQEKINIYKILDNVPIGTKLYSPICGECALNVLENEAIEVETQDNEGWWFTKYGRTHSFPDAECLLFPSKEMRDWGKFFKKGDVLEYTGKNGNANCIFESYEDYTMERFIGRFTIADKGKYVQAPTSFITNDWYKSKDQDGYIKKVEKYWEGKLNLETLELERGEKQDYEVGKLYYFHFHHDLTIPSIGELTSIFNDHIIFGSYLKTNDGHFETEREYHLLICDHPEFRPATAEECEHFVNAKKRWENSQETEELKLFDKVLVRNSDNRKWLPGIFVKETDTNDEYRHVVMCLLTGNVGGFIQCIPFEKHERLAFTDFDKDTLPF